MELKIAFNKLSGAKDYDGLLALAKTLDNVGDFELSDKITEYANLSGKLELENRQASYEGINKRFAASISAVAEKQERIIDGPLARIFTGIINAQLHAKYKSGIELSLGSLPYARGIAEVMNDSETKRHFYDQAFNFFSYRHDLSREHAKNRVYRAWQAFKKYIDQHYQKPSVPENEIIEARNSKNLGYTSALKMLFHAAEGILRSYHIDFELGDLLNPHSHVFYEVFGPHSQIASQIKDQLTNDIGPEKTEAVFNKVKEDIASMPIDRRLMEQAVNKHKRMVKNRSYDLYGDSDLDMILQAINIVDPSIQNPKNIFNPSFEEHWKFFDGYNLYRLHEVLYDLAFNEYQDEVKAKAVADRLYDSVKKINVDNIKKFPQYAQKQQKYMQHLQEIDDQRKRQQEQEQNYQNQMSTFTEQEDKKRSLDNLGNDIQQLMQKRQQTPSYKPVQKKWYEFWKKACEEYNIRV